MADLMDDLAALKIALKQLDRRLSQYKKELVAERTSRDRLEADLELIAAIHPGMTISTSTKMLVYRKSWLAATSRYFNSDSREKTVSWIETVIAKAIPQFLFSVDFGFRNQVLQARNGINNLKETYLADTEIQIRCCNLNIAINLAFQATASPDNRVARMTSIGLPEPMEAQRPIDFSFGSLHYGAGWKDSIDLNLEEEEDLPRISAAVFSPTIIPDYSEGFKLESPEPSEEHLVQSSLSLAAHPDLHE